MNIDFKIEDKNFTVPDSIFGADSFIIKSTPRDYGVVFETHDDPMTSVIKLFEENPKNLMLIDRKVYDLYKGDTQISPDRVFLADANENFKTIEWVMQVVDFLKKNSFGKGEKLIVVGGGTIQDVGAFVGAIYKRGITWVHFPTTLLAMCDSCIGGKTGINYKAAKNQLGLFSAPSGVVINAGFLKTLDGREISSGLGEISKLCITGGDYFWKIYTDNTTNGKVTTFDAFRNLIIAALAVKKAVVEVDEFDLNYRRSMNYGHTVGHAIEVLSDYVIPHGQAVAIGVIVVNTLAMKRGDLNNELAGEIQKPLVGLLSDEIKDSLRNLKTEKIADLLKMDKKAIGSMVNFVLIKKLGDTFFLKINIDNEFVSELNNILSSILK
ncbi:MAG: 3-dehydroquinate synthase family protein [Candidatus Magasanikbacteria bacterium]